MHKILCELALSLLYLHEKWEQKVVHQDVKANNIMLYKDFNARFSDFNPTYLIEHDKTSSIVNTKLVGTP